MKDLVLIYNARAGYIDLGHQDFFCQTVVQQKTRNWDIVLFSSPVADVIFVRATNLIKFKNKA